LDYDIHRLNIRLKGHAKDRWDERYPNMPYKMLIHHFKTGKMIKKPNKEGEVGRIVKSLKDRKIGFKFIISQGEAWIITVE